MKIVINYPVIVEADVESHDAKTEKAFQFEKTDMVTLHNAKLPAVIRIPAESFCEVKDLP